ncbi:hypothetical protein PLUTE_b1050 [Pseudoalteromonas luteoviolacea DSM 6061]|nr:hypothetical protein [Pseudoalteromonas luteoviolacea DSM 6061]
MGPAALPLPSYDTCGGSGLILRVLKAVLQPNSATQHNSDKIDLGLSNIIKEKSV